MNNEPIKLFTWHYEDGDKRTVFALSKTQEDAEEIVSKRWRAYPKIIEALNERPTIWVSGDSMVLITGANINP